jgi:hypothetical protein
VLRCLTVQPYSSSACRSVVVSSKPCRWKLVLPGEVKRLREQAAMLPRGRLREEVERKAVQFEAAYEVAELLRPPQSNTAD